MKVTFAVQFLMNVPSASSFYLTVPMPWAQRICSESHALQRHKGIALHSTAKTSRNHIRAIFS